MDQHGAGWRLRSARAELGLTEDALAADMRRWAELTGRPRRDITAETVADWEAGARRPDQAALRLLWMALELPGWDRLRLDGGDGADTWALFRPSRSAANQAQRRRELLRHLAALGGPTALDPEHLSGALEETLKVDPRLVEALTRIARRFPKEWGHRPARELRGQIHRHLQIVHALLDGVMPGRTRRELESAAATTATLAGLISTTLNRQEEAGTYLEIGQRLADRSGDVEVRALALVFSGHLVSPVKPDAEAADPARSRALVDAALGLVGPRTAPLARAWVLLRGAEEYAWAGDELGAYRLMDEGERLSLSARAPADGMVSPWTTDTHITFQGEVAAICGRFDQARELLERGIAKLGPDKLVTRPRAIADLAGVHARGGDIDRACALLAQALELAHRTGLPELLGRIADVRTRYLAGHEAEPAVRRLDDQLAAT